jgi:hypothetical protein
VTLRIEISKRAGLYTIYSIRKIIIKGKVYDDSSLKSEWHDKWGDLGSRFWFPEPRTTIDAIVVKGSPHLTAVFLA